MQRIELSDRSIWSGLALLALCFVVWPAASTALAQTYGQTATTEPSGENLIEVRDRIMQSFNGSSRKLVQLAEAMPAELYDYAPGEGVMTFATVYGHIARYNFGYLHNELGIPAPQGVDLDGLESLTDKGELQSVLLRSMEHVRQHVGAMTASDLAKRTTLYGDDVAAWAVLLQLVAHMNEHVGQAVAYARVNAIVPPWSRPRG